MSGGEFPLDVDADQVALAATRLRTLAGDLEAERAGVSTAPDTWATGWRGGAATAVTTEATALAGHMAAFDGHLQTAASALDDLATAYRTALEETLPALRARWADAKSAYGDAVAASSARRTGDYDAIPADAGQQRRMWQMEADSAHTARTSAAATERTTTQATATAAYDQLLADLRTRTAATGQALAAAVVVPVPDETVSTYLATGTTDLGPLPPAQLADLTLAQQHQVAEDLEVVALLVEQDLTEGVLDETHLDDLDALLGFTGGRVLLADAARGARERVAGAMADLGRAATAHEADGDGEAAAADVQLLGTLLGRYAEDEAMTSPFLVDLGGAGALDLTLAVDQLSAGDPAANPLLTTAAALRTAVQTSSRDSAFPGSSFARELVGRAVDRLDDDSLRASPGTALSYLLDGDHYGTWFLTSAVEELAAAEQAHAGERGGDGSDLWLQDGPRPSHLATTFEGAPDMHEDGVYTAYQNSWDPLLSAVRQLADEPMAGRDALVGSTGEYLFRDRGWAHDGFEAIIAAGATAATDASPGTVGWDGAARAASAMVNGMGARTDLDELSPTAVDGVANVVAAHLDGVLQSTAVRATDVSEGDTGPRGLVLDAPGEGPTVAYFAASALDRMTEVASGTESASELLRQSASDFQSDLMGRTAAVVGDESTEDPQLVLDEMLKASARLEAHFTQAGGHAAEQMGRERDDVVGFWLGAAEFATDKAGAALGSTPHPMGRLASLGVETVGGPAYDALERQVAGAEDEAEAAARAAADLAADRLVYGYVQALYNTGAYVPEGVPGSALEGGALPLHQQLDEQSLTAIASAFRATGRVSVDWQSTADTMAVENLDAYRELE